MTWETDLLWDAGWCTQSSASPERGRVKRSSCCQGSKDRKLLGGMPGTGRWALLLFPLLGSQAEKLRHTERGRLASICLRLTALCGVTSPDSCWAGGTADLGARYLEAVVSNGFKRSRVEARYQRLLRVSKGSPSSAELEGKGAWWR